MDPSTFSFLNSAALSPLELWTMYENEEDANEILAALKNKQDLSVAFVHFISLQRHIERLEKMTENINQESHQVFQYMKRKGLVQDLLPFVTRKRTNRYNALEHRRTRKDDRTEYNTNQESHDPSSSPLSPMPSPPLSPI